MIHLKFGDESTGNFHLPGVGLRIIRSLCAVFLCFTVYFLRENPQGAFVSSMAALMCVRPYTDNRRKMVRESLAGTAIGAFWGFFAAWIFSCADNSGEMILGGLAMAVLLGAVLYSTVAFDLKNISFFSCMVYLSIAMAETAGKSVLFIAAGQIFDTVTGVLIAVVVSSVYLPRMKNKDILFVSGVDDTLLTREEKLSPYSRVELNRLIDDGAHFTLSTLRTPASLMESVGGLHLNLPVITMDGAALYDINENSYLLTYMMSYQNSKRIIDFLEERNLNTFANVVIDDLLVIYYRRLKNSAEQDIYKSLRKSPHRNYVNRALPENENVVYFMVIDKKEVIAKAYAELMEKEWISEYKVLTYDSHDYPGFAYIKIYNKEATRENMLRNLMAMIDMDKSMTFGSIPGKYDVLIEDSDHNRMVRKLRKAYEPVRLFGKWKQSR